MADLRRLINSQMTALIRGTFGSMDAAAAAVNAALPRESNLVQSTLSKRKDFTAYWPLEEIQVLQDAAGKYPINDTLVRLQNEAGAAVQPSCLYTAVGEASKEFGEAISANLRAKQSADAGDIANAIVETRESLAATERLLSALEAMGASR